MQKVNKIHFVGIKGVGMTPLAIIAKEAGIHVTGSDISETFITDTALKEQNIKVYVGFSADHVKDADMVIVTSAHGGLDNIEAVTAKEKNIPVISQAQAVGEFMKGEILGKPSIGISVSGSHGKTTTSAMIASILTAAGYDPSYLIGTSYIQSLGYSGHLGKGKHFIAEADEYVTELTYDHTPKFLWQHPKYLVITNIEHDHPDVYPDLLSVRKSFEQFIQQLDKDSSVIICGDDPQLKTIASSITNPIHTYGYSQGNEFYISNVQMGGEQTSFSLKRGQEDLGQFTISVPGEHNVLNATAAIIIALLLGLSVADIKKHCQVFTGSKRRLEYIGESSQGAVLYDDYGHHPTEVTASLVTIRKIFPKYFIICIFQPHTFSRTQALLLDFSRAFQEADFVVITSTYASLREKQEIPQDPAQELCEAIVGTGKHAQYLSSLSNVVEYIHEQKFPSPTLIVTMGAGDVYKILPEL